jgi:hypothetical protein
VWSGRNRDDVNGGVCLSFGRCQSCNKRVRSVVLTSMPSIRFMWYVVCSCPDDKRSIALEGLSKIGAGKHSG